MVSVLGKWPPSAGTVAVAPSSVTNFMMWSGVAGPVTGSSAAWRIRKNVAARRMRGQSKPGAKKGATAFVTALYGVAEHPLRVRALRGLMAEAQLDPAFEEPFRQWVESRRAVVRELLTRGLDRGELPAGADLELAADQVFGTFWYRLLVGHAPLDPAEAAHHAARVLDGLRGGPENRP